MDHNKDIAPAINDNDGSTLADTAAARLLSASGFVKAEAFQVEPPASEKPKKRLLLEDYKGLGDFDNKPYNAPDSPVFLDYEKRIFDQIDKYNSNKNGKDSHKNEAPNPVDSEELLEASQLSKKAALAIKAGEILYGNWSNIDLDGNDYLSKEELDRNSGQYESYTDTKKGLDYIKDNFDKVSNLYQGELFGAENSISKSDVKFLANLGRATVQDKYYHERANNYLKDHFKEIDTNNDGSLSHEELSAKLEKTDSRSPEAGLLQYSISRQQENYSNGEAVGYGYNSMMANPKAISQKDLDMTLDERLAKSREDIFVQNYYSMYGEIGTRVGLVGGGAAILAAESLTGNTGFFTSWQVMYPTVLGTALIGRETGNYFDKRASRNYFHKEQEANLKNLLDPTTGSF